VVFGDTLVELRAEIRACGRLAGWQNQFECVV
jgi:hypothetical protein